MARQSADYHRKLAERVGYSGASPYNMAAWRKLRAAHRQGEPLCRMCGLDGRVTIGALVDHIVPVDRDPSLFLDDDNLQTLCNDCHERKTSIDSGHKPAVGCDEAGFPLGGWSNK